MAIIIPRCHLYVYAYYHDISNLNIWCVLLSDRLHTTNIEDNVMLGVEWTLRRENRP